MKHTTPRETSPGTDSARLSIDNFDCELPPEAKSELLRPRRIRILGQPPCPPQKPPQVDSVRSRGHPALGWLLALIGLVLLGAVIYLSWPSPANRAAALQESAARSREVEQQADRALDALQRPAAQTPVVQPTPAVLPPGWNADGTAVGRAGTIPEVRRALPVPVTVRRAEFIHPARASVPTPPQPDQPVYREWVPEAGGWILADAQCVPIRGTFIADPAPRAELASTAVCQP